MDGIGAISSKITHSLKLVITAQNLLLLQQLQQRAKARLAKMQG
jgi:hypothetical protein